MNIFDLVLTQPVFNLLLFLYEILPGRDLGVAIIIFTIIIRLLMWPLVRKQLHQGKAMRQLQPEMAKIKKKAAGDRQLQGRLTMELYKEKEINPLSSIGILLVQLPIFIALYSSVRIITDSQKEIPKFTYGFMENIRTVPELLASPEKLDATFLGFIDLTERAINASGWAAMALVAIAAITALLMFFQTRQLMPKPKDQKRLRDMLKDQAKGKDVDQAEVMTAATQRTMYLFPFLIFFVSTFIVSGALALYIFATTAMGFVQQKIILGKDEEELEEIADEARNGLAKPVSANSTPNQKANLYTSAKAKKSNQSRRKRKQPARGQNKSGNKPTAHK